MPGFISGNRQGDDFEMLLNISLIMAAVSGPAGGGNLVAGDNQEEGQQAATAQDHQIMSQDFVGDIDQFFGHVCSLAVCGRFLEYNCNPYAKYLSG
jgi:hypothetical protein